jgi:flagellin-like protein
MRTITKIRRSIRAISPVISVLLMIAIAVVASLVAYAWIMGYMGATTTRVSKAIMIQSSAISDVWNTLLVYVQNVGSTPVEFISTACVYINDELKACNISGYNPLDQGETVTFVVGGADAMGYPVRIKVVTIDGITAENIAWKLNSGAASPLKTSIFYSGFESGDFSAWTGKEGVHQSVQNTVKYTGTYAARFQISGGLSDCYKTITPMDNCYFRAYINFASLPSISGYKVQVIMINVAGNDHSYIGLYVFNDGGTQKWQVYYNPNGAGRVELAATATPAIAVNTWYCVEIHAKNGAGTAEVNGWVNETSVGSANGLTFADQAVGPTLGLANRFGYATMIMYGDCAVVADAYIGP